MLQDEFTSVLRVDQRDELLKHVVGFTRRLGFETVGAIVVIDRPCGETEFICLDNAPEAYRGLFEDTNKGRRDPVAQHCKRQGVPIVWDQSAYTSAGLGEA